MIRNYLKIALRNLRKSRLYAAINISGLAVGIACFILLALYVRNEWTYDSFHGNAAHIYRIVRTYGHGGGETVRTAYTASAMLPALKKEIPGIQQGVRMTGTDEAVTVQYKDRVLNEKQLLFADEGFFSMFSFPLKQGNPLTALKGPNTIVITASAARKYFGEEDPVGKVLRIDDRQDMVITGVAEDVPANSHIRFNVVASFSSLPGEDNWNAPNYYSYVQLREHVSAATFRQHMEAFFEKIEGRVKPGEVREYIPEPLTAVHLRSAVDDGLDTPADLRYIYILAVVAVLLLVVACINFMNMVTARAAERAREIGVRKTMGAQRRQLFWQFMSESGMITLVALVLGVLLARLALPAFNDLADRPLEMDWHNGYWLYTLLAGLFMLTTLLTGAYPALFLSAFRPATVLKSKLSAVKGGGMRKALVVFQFAASAFFIICTLVVARQLYYIQHKKLGMDRSRIIVLPGKGFEAKSLLAFKNRLQQQPGVGHVSAAYTSPVAVNSGYAMAQIDGKPADFYMNVTGISVDKDYVKTMGMELVAGEDLTDADIKSVMVEEKDRTYHFFLNETAVKQLGWTPVTAIGKRFNMNGRAGPVKGVLKDFHFTSMKQAIMPIVVFPEYDYTLSEVLVKLSAADPGQVTGKIRQVWGEFFPGIPFDYHFLDQEFDNLYRAEYRISYILSLFAGVIILISCLGLFGLATFTARQRSKEISIRKVLGASVAQVVGLLSGDFVKLVLIAVLIAAPLAGYIMQQWLDGFAYRTRLSLWIFGLAGLVAVLIALVTVSVQSVKAALANPAKWLRTE